MNKEKKVILKVLIGSRAHGLANKDSDYDYRAVYVLPTSDILSIGYKYKGNSWFEGDNHDNTAYEIGHFLKLATQCNPTILEVFKAPIIEANEDGIALQKLFSCIWSPKQSFDAFVGYGNNQRKKFLDKKDHRQNKFAIAYVRTLWNLIELLETGDFSVEVKEKEIKRILMDYKNGMYKTGEVIDTSEALIKEAKRLLANCKQESDLEKVNRFLVDIRRRHW